MSASKQQRWAQGSGAAQLRTVHMQLQRFDFPHRHILTKQFNTQANTSRGVCDLPGAVVHAC